MSYDVCLEVDTGGKERAPLGVLNRNYTYNVSDMIHAAMGCGLTSLHGMRAGDAAKHLEAALWNLKLEPERYRAMNPPNGWGDYEGCIEFLGDIAVACREHPDAYVGIY